MANILKNVFSSEDPQYKATLKFKSPKFHKDFLEALKTVSNEGINVEIKGLDTLETYIEDGDTKKLFHGRNSISNVFIGPSMEECPFEIDTDYGKYTFAFERLTKENEVVVENASNSIVHFCMVFNIKEKIVTFTYKTNPKISENILSISCAYNAAWHLFKELFVAQGSDEIEQAIRSFKSMESYWNRVHSIEEFLNINFNPQNINDIREDEIDIEKLHLLLIKDVPIRQNLKDVTYTINYSAEFDKEKFKKGGQLRLADLETHRYKIYGTEFCIYMVNVIYNVIINSVEDNPEMQEYIIKAISTDSNPMYSVYKAFKTKEEAELELNGFNTDKSIFVNAKTFNELMEEQKDFYSAIREKA